MRAKTENRLLPPELRCTFDSAESRLCRSSLVQFDPRFLLLTITCLINMNEVFIFTANLSCKCGLALRRCEEA